MADSEIVTLPVDLTQWEPHEDVPANARAWMKDGSAIVVGRYPNGFEIPPLAPIERMRDFYREVFRKRRVRLISVDLVSVANLPAIVHVTQEGVRNAPKGTQVFRTCLMIPRHQKGVAINVQSYGRLDGGRECMGLLLQDSNPDFDAYSVNVDEHMPDHPLSRSRMQLRSMLDGIVVSAEFASLPPFEGHPEKLHWELRIPLWRFWYKRAKLLSWELEHQVLETSWRPERCISEDEVEGSRARSEQE